MSKPSSGTSGGDSRTWDQPDGLGWQVWRRARSTALLTQPMQRDLARLRTNILRDPAPLLTDIRRRWALGDSVVNRFSLSSPLLWVQRRAFHDGVGVEPAVLAPLSPRYPGITDVASSALPPTLSGASELPQVMKTAGGEWTHGPQRTLTVSEPMDVNSDVQRTEQIAHFSKPRVIESERSFDTFNSRVMRRSLPPQRLIAGDAQPLAVNSRTPLFTSVGRRQDMRLVGSAQAMTGRFPGTDRARVSLRWDDASMPASLISSKRNADFTTVMRAIPGDLQAPALQRREIVGRRVPIPTSTPSATTRASEGEIGPFNTAPLLDSSPVGRQIMTSSRIAVSKEPTAGPSLERTTQTQNAAADVIRRREARGLLQAKHDSELPIDRPARNDESVMRTAAEPTREHWLRAEPMLTRHATSEGESSATGLSRKPQYEAMAETSLPLVHTETALPLHTVTPRNASTVGREISLSRAEQFPIPIKAEDQGMKAADRHDPAGGVEQALPTGSAAKSVELGRSLDRIGPRSVPAVDVSSSESDSQAARRPQPSIYGATMLHRFFDHRTAGLWHEAGDPRIARRISPLTQTHYGGGVPGLYDLRAAGLWQEAGDPRIARRISPLAQAHDGGGVPGLYNYRTAQLWHEAGDPRIARRISSLTQAHYSGEVPMQRSAERAVVASSRMATIRRVAELTEPGARTPADAMSFATVAPTSLMPARARDSASNLSGEVGQDERSSPGIDGIGFPGGAIGNEPVVAQRESLIHRTSFREIPLARHAIATARQRELGAADKPISQLTQFLPITSGSEQVVRGFGRDPRVQRQPDSQGFLHSLPVALSSTIATLDYSPGSYGGFSQGLPAETKFPAAALDGLAAGPRIGNAMIHRFSHGSSVPGGYDSRARVFLNNLPLVASQRIDRSENSAGAPRSVNDIVQAASQSPVGAMNGAAGAAFIGGRAEPRAPQANADPAAAQMDIDELVEKAWRKLMRRLTIEQERRGYSRWL